MPRDGAAQGRGQWAAWIVGAGAFALAAIGAHPYAGSWNDGSRLAAVESLVDHHTLAIDNSIFTRRHEVCDADCALPYPPNRVDLLERGTRDKLWVGGHFYSDKPAVISVLMALVYWLAQTAGCPQASARPDLFCWFLTVATSGIAYAYAVGAMYLLGTHIGLSNRTRLLWLGSFALATVSLTYSRQVNNHILLLGVMSAVCLQCARLGLSNQRPASATWPFVCLGSLTGLAYNLDAGCGPLLLPFICGWAFWRGYRLVGIGLILLSATPWVGAFHVLNYMIGGVWKPINMVPAYAEWEGSPFNASNLTGIANHGLAHFSVYAAALLFGKHGFIVYNLPLLLLFPAVGWLLRHPQKLAPEFLATSGWCLACWLLYAWLSNNYGGLCCSVRWFVPFLAPAFFLIAGYLNQHPQSTVELIILSLWGLILSAVLWTSGPWEGHVPRSLWPIVGCALLSWYVYRARIARSAHLIDPSATPKHLRRAA